MPLASGSGLRTRKGFDTEFLGLPTPLPVLAPSIADDAVLVDGSPILQYEHFSIAMSASRTMARWVAWNVDGGELVEEGRFSGARRRFKQDRRLEPEQQILSGLYRGNLLDRGHIARRADLLWGTRAEAARANSDSFYFPNITPQMFDFNQSTRGGLWGLLENALLRQAELTRHRISLFGGPVLATDDRPYRSILVPDEWWKLFVYVLDDKPRAKAFRLTQSLEELERAAEGEIVLPEWVTYEISLDDLSALTSLQFASVIHGLGDASLDRAPDRPRPVRALTAVAW
jgi:endonuclease G